MGEDSQGFVRLWGRIYEDLSDFGRGFTRLWERICEDPQLFMRFGRGFLKIRDYSQDFGRGFMSLGEDS